MRFANAVDNSSLCANSFASAQIDSCRQTRTELIAFMELNFDVRREDGLLVAVCHEPEMATHGRTVEELIQMVRELILCHFDEGDERRTAKARFNFHEESALAYA